MKKIEEIVVLEDSDEAAQPKTVTGWVSRLGNFYLNEASARYDGSTHKKCACGKIITKYCGACDDCSAKRSIENYNKLPFKEWDHVTPVCDYHDDRFFFSPDDIEDYLADSEEDINLQLVICEPNHLNEIDYDYWQDLWPEDGEPPKEFEKKLEELNAYIRTMKPVSWGEGKYRTEYARQIDTGEGTN